MRYIYILRCSDKSLYTGITTNLKRRIQEHNHDSTGAKYTKMRRPVSLVWSQEAKNRSIASKVEHMIKKMTRAKKQEIIDEKLVIHI